MSDVINGVPREDLQQLVNVATGGMWKNAPWVVRTRALLTAQPQAAPDEAVAQWQSMSCGEGGRWFNIADSDAEQAKSDGFEVRALYTHPAPSQPSGRVELSRQFVDAVKQLCKDFSDLQNRPYMGDVYAALDGLLEHEQIPVAATPHPEQPQASAAQSAPAGEREACSECNGLGFGPFGGCGECCGSGQAGAAPAQPAARKVYGCPRCGTGMEVDESAKPAAQGQGEVQRLREALEACMDAMWEDSREVRMDDTMMMGLGYDWDGWEDSRWELHTRQGSFAIWPAHGTYSAYGGLHGSYWNQCFANAQDAKSAIVAHVAKIDPEHPVSLAHAALATLSASIGPEVKDGH